MEETKKEEEKKRFPRAKKFARLIKKGRGGQVHFQAFRSSPSFKRTTRNLKKLKRSPKYLKKSVLRQNTWDRFSILLNPCTSERFYKKMENENTIIFYVAQKANKQEIKAAFKEAFGVKPQRVNTYNTILGRKKAFIKIPKSNEASEIANKIGLI
jgi:large subunit ribosomal protein L23Ae